MIGGGALQKFLAKAGSGLQAARGAIGDGAQALGQGIKQGVQGSEGLLGGQVGGLQQLNPQAKGLLGAGAAGAAGLGAGGALAAEEMTDDDNVIQRLLSRLGIEL